jgi:hypothetical protein
MVDAIAVQIRRQQLWIAEKLTAGYESQICQADSQDEAFRERTERGDERWFRRQHGGEARPGLPQRADCCGSPPPSIARDFG